MNNKGMIVVAILAIALVAVVVLWARDRDSQDVQLEIDVPEEIGLVHELPAAPFV